MRFSGLVFGLSSLGSTLVSLRFSVAGRLEVHLAFGPLGPLGLLDEQKPDGRVHDYYESSASPPILLGKSY